MSISAGISSLSGICVALGPFIHAEVKGEYGWPRVWKELLARGIRVGKELVR